MSEGVEWFNRERNVLATARSSLSHRRGMMSTTNRYNQFNVGGDGPSFDAGNTLVPMLIGGLGLIVVGMLAVGIFVG
jgi:hypothetical protein